MAVTHYENFPVASLLLPAHLRAAVEVIYTFARTADDLADEGSALPQERLDALAVYEQELDLIAADKKSSSSLFQSLRSVIQNHQLPVQPFRDLLSAFKQDVETTRYPTFISLLDYCSRSANPVGLIMLHLYRNVSEQNIRDSDSICSALQLINFLQDIAVDWNKARIYLPQEDLIHFGVSEQHIANADLGNNWRNLMSFEAARARTMLLSGAPLALRMTGRIGWELRLVIQGGLRILERIEAVHYDVFHNRPQLNMRDWLLMGWRAVRM